jgi:hypothetical protein
MPQSWERVNVSKKQKKVEARLLPSFLAFLFKVKWLGRSLAQPRPTETERLRFTPRTPSKGAEVASGFLWVRRQLHGLSSAITPRSGRVRLRAAFAVVFDIAGRAGLGLR